MDMVDEIKKKRPECDIHVYDAADHGFHCDERGSYHAESAKIAWGRTTAFLEKNMK
jgi:carboxymethylenebutenolidase